MTELNFMEHKTNTNISDDWSKLIKKSLNETIIISHSSVVLNYQKVTNYERFQFLMTF